MKNELLKQEILTMVYADQKMRKSNHWNLDLDKQNTERVKKIISQYGWPGKSIVGEEAANGIWLLVQHADHDIEFQKTALKFLQEAVISGEAEKNNEAYLIDRVKVNSGQPQIFGTQFYEDKKKQFGPWPIEDFENIEKRRMQFGLEPFFNYKQLMLRRHVELKNKEEQVV
ncbi:MAG: hypothetical protein KBC69_04820 [Candidatus Magasanikbacteria bacterium]|nr:hypothetical protein [Candidatus Magasanikbacteria bacterium]